MIREDHPQLTPYGALHRANATQSVEGADSIPLRALFSTLHGHDDSFFTQTDPQQGFLTAVSAGFDFVGPNDAGVVDPLARDYSVVLDHGRARGDERRWGVPGAPPVFQ